MSIEVEKSEKPAICHRCRRTIAFGEEFQSQQLIDIDANAFEIAWHVPKCPTTFDHMVREQLSDGLHWLLNYEANDGRPRS